ncbi:MAG: guanylate kinase [Desulfovibrio sp.]|jgi:guanylate kinase|nr:guanylate kinase [Desulfovibrio sp.]
MQREGVALVVSAPSGTGKTTLVKRLLAEFSNFGYSVSCTTRKPRVGEVNGRDYWFLSREEFERRRDQNYFAEWADVYGNLYGTPLEPVRQMLREGRDALFDIDVQGAAQLKLSLGEATFVFILPPGLDALERRLRGRGLDDEQAIQKRLDGARWEMIEARWYNALIVNDTLDKAYDELRAVYLAATLAPVRNRQLVQEMLSR